MEFQQEHGFSVAKLHLKCLRPRRSIAISVEASARRALESAGFESQLLD
jgi:hypothetical protein